MTKLAVLSFIMWISFVTVLGYNIYLNVSQHNSQLNNKQKDNVLKIYYLLRPIYGFTQSLCLLLNFNFSNEIYGLCCNYCDRCCYQCCKSNVKYKVKASWKFKKLPNK